jgi:hypothetical protein
MIIQPITTTTTSQPLSRRPAFTLASQRSTPRYTLPYRHNRHNQTMKAEIDVVEK